MILCLFPLKGNLTIKSLEIALEKRVVEPDLIVHSDQEIQKTSQDFQKMLEKNVLLSSMSRKGSCWDNAVMESFSGT